MRKSRKPRGKWKTPKRRGTITKQITPPTLPRTPRSISSISMTSRISRQDTQELRSGTRTRETNTHQSDTHTLHPDTHTRRLDIWISPPCTSLLPAHILPLLHSLLIIFPHPTSLSTLLLLHPSSIRLSPLLSGHQTLSPSLISPLLLPHLSDISTLTLLDSWTNHPHVPITGSAFIASHSHWLQINIYLSYVYV